MASPERVRQSEKSAINLARSSAGSETGRERACVASVHFQKHATGTNLQERANIKSKQVLARSLAQSQTERKCLLGWVLMR